MIEDNPGDYALIKQALESGNLFYELDWEKSLEMGVKNIQKNSPDTVLLDLGLPDSSGLDTLISLIDLKADCSILVLTGNADEMLGLEAMKIGAHDYLIKGEFPPTTLPRAIRYSVERKESEKILLNHQMILEKEVEKRTAELIKTNNRLKEEIDMRREVEKSLTASEENFRLISISAQDAIVKMD